MRDEHPYRLLMPLVVRRRGDASVYFDQELDLRRTLRFLEAWNAQHPEARATLFHVVVWAAIHVLHQRPHFNRFVAGGRLWQRDGVWISYAAKRRLDDRSPVVTLKRRFGPARFGEVVEGLREQVAARRGAPDEQDEPRLDRVARLPVVLQRLLYALYRLADAWGLLPRRMIDRDPLYASLFVTNLGSLDMEPCYHHLYEHGTASVVCAVGRVREVPAVEDGRLVVRPAATLRYTYDERIVDGLYAHRSLERARAMIENPERGLPGLPEPGRDGAPGAKASVVRADRKAVSQR